MSKKMRVGYFLFSLACLEAAYYFVSGKWGIPVDSNIIWFQAGALSFMLGVFLTEYHHTKPTDALITSVSLFFTVATLNNPPHGSLWIAFKVMCSLVFLGAFFLSWVDKVDFETRPFLQKASRTTYLIIKKLGSAKILCTVAFILGVISFVDPAKRNVLLVGWIVLFAISAIRPHEILTSLLNLWKGTPDGHFCGVVTRFEQPNIVFIEVTSEVKINQVVAVCKSPVFETSCLYAMVLDTFHGNNSRFVRAVVLDQYRWEGQNYVFFAETPETVLEKSNIFKNREKIVGLIGPFSEIGKINVQIDNDRGLVNNQDIVEVNIGEFKVLYQIVNALVNEETVSKDVIGYKKAIAVQVGSWNSEKLCFDDYKWVPPLNSVVYKTDNYEDAIEIESDLFLIGTFNTGHPIIVKKADLVTHNTAILGVTGSGKSYLGYSVIEGLLSKQIKTICIDNTGDYQREVRWTESTLINNPAEVDAFLSSGDFYAIATATNVNSVLLIVEKVYQWVKEQYNPAQIEIVPKVCIFMEEAHTAIPEWNSIVERDDQQKVNKISKYVMQGRKFGMGVIVVTQRTANVTKSVLSQCNTIISFQAFDKTSNDFLSSFMDEDYIDNIGRLDTGCAVIAGKALLSGRPVVIKAPDRIVIQEMEEHVVQAAPTDNE